VPNDGKITSEQINAVTSAKHGQQSA
jgi:hypothetical protein